MYRLSVSGVTRNGEFEIDFENSRFQRTYLDVYDDGTSNGDVFEVKIKDGNSPSNLHEFWMILKGKPEDIIAEIEDRFPMAKLEAEAIFNELEKCEDGGTTFITYPLAPATSPVIANSHIYKTLRAFHQAIVASMFEKERNEVTVINI